MNAAIKVFEPDVKPNKALLTEISPREITVIPEGDGEGFMRLTVIRRDGKTHRSIQHYHGEEAQTLWASICKDLRIATNAKRRKPE